MKDVFDISWVMRQIEFNLKYFDGSDVKKFEEFGCDKIIKQALHEEFLQALSPTLPPKALNNFIINIHGYFYEKFNLDDMKLASLNFKDGNFILYGDIQDYITEEGLLNNSYESGLIFRSCKLTFENVKNLTIINGIGEPVYLSEPFKYPVDLICGGFSYNIVQKKHKYTVFLQSIPTNANAKRDIINNIAKNTFQIDFEYSDIDLYLGAVESSNTEANNLKGAKK